MMIDQSQSGYEYYNKIIHRIILNNVIIDLNLCKYLYLNPVFPIMYSIHQHDYFLQKSYNLSTV